MPDKNVRYTPETLKMIAHLLKCSEDEAVQYLAAIAEVTHETKSS